MTGSESFSVDGSVQKQLPSSVFRRCYRQTTFHSDLQAMERIAEGVYDEELSDEFELTRAGKDVREAAEELVRKFLRHDLEVGSPLVTKTCFRLGARVKDF